MGKHWILPITALALGGCQGLIVDDDPESDSTSTVAASSRFPRLTHAQWDNTVRDLFGFAESPDLSRAFQPDPPLGRFDNNILRLSVTSGHWIDYQRAAEVISERVVTDPASLAALVAGDTEARPLIERFGRRAFRRPLTSAEVDRYVAIYESGPQHYADLEADVAGVRLVIESMLQSPHFLYRAELTEGSADTPIALSGYELASRLSYALWNTMPSDELLAAAEAGELDSAESLRSWAPQLFADQRSGQQFEHFHTQAYALLEYEDLAKDENAFPQWHDGLGPLLREETQSFLRSMTFEGGTIADLLTSTRAFVNDELAALYGVEGDFGPELQEVQLGADRAGLLTRIGFLARNATRAEPDPIHRGVWINLNLLCRTIAAVPNLPDNLMPTGDTNRERIDSITGEGTCGAGCHASIINPLGFALEGFDAIGAARDQDNGFPLDTADRYTFEDGRTIEFGGAIELSQELAQAPELHACYVQNLLEYLSGRDLTEADRELVAELAQASLEEQLTIEEIVIRIVASEGFRMRPADSGASQ